MKILKNILLTAFLAVSLPINVLAYSNYIIPGGESIGIEIQSDGIMIVGFYKINGKFNKGTPTIKVGDKITEVNGVSVDKTSDMVSLMEREVEDGSVTLTINRDGSTKKVKLDLIEEKGVYKTGLYVKDEVTGIGTLTYIDPETKIFGSLGHNIVESNTNRSVEVKNGTIFRSSVTSIDRSVSGVPGGKNAKFYSSSVYGTINKNAINGIYGTYNKELPNKEALEVGKIEDAKKGPATIVTVLEKEKLEEFEIEITKIDTKSDIKNIYFNVTDKNLLEKTGGIVQGMSGSPIIQDNKIIGAVTHVVISEPSSGYGIDIRTMLEEGEKTR